MPTRNLGQTGFRVGIFGLGGQAAVELPDNDAVAIPIIEALTAAREQRLVRFLGVSGHADPDVLIAMLERFPFDTILLALNAADRHRRPFAERLLPLAVERRMGIIGMKIPARSRLLSS